jgi:uncharacterized membrane protein
MSIGTTISLAIHLVTGAVWVGAITFTVSGVLPASKAGDLNAAPLGSMASTLRNYSRVAAVLLLATGAHLGVTRYSAESLTGTGQGHLVLTMIGLWFVTTGLVEVGAGKLVDGADEMKVREPAHDADTILKVAALLGVLILVDAAVLLGNYYLV